VQLPYVLPCWVPARRLKDSEMIELDVYYFYWLSICVGLLDRVKPGVPLGAILQELGYARIGIEAFKDDVATAFPRTATQAQELLRLINQVLPPVGSPIADLGRPFSKYEADQIHAFCTSLAAAFKDESQRGYVLKVEDQRCLSAYSLVEKIENCFHADAWKVIEADAKREFEECGKCLSVERYTASGFHALRGVECVIRQYIKELTGELPRKRDWGFYIETLKKNGADDKLSGVLDNIRTLERNPLMHPEDWLDIDEAIAIFTISQTAITRLASGVTKTRAAKGTGHS